METSRPARLRREAAITVALALPVIAAQLLSVGKNVADTLLAGRLGTSVLAAVAMGYQVWVLALLVVIGVMLAVTPTVAQLDGARRRGESGAVFRQALWLALALGVLLFVGIRQSAPLLRAVGVEASILPDALRFLEAISWAAPSLAVFFACKNFSEGLSLTRPAMYFGAAGLVLLVPLAWALMYGRLGLPALGAQGAGYAHALVQTVEALAFLAYVAGRRHYAEARPFARFDAPDAREILRLLRIGLPMGFAILMEGSLFVATALLVGTLGAVPAAAHQIAINVASVTFMVPLGLGMATTVRIGNAVGRRDLDGVRWAAGAGLALVLGVQLASASAIALFATPLARAFTPDPAAIALASTLLVFAAWFQFSDGVQALFNGALRGLKDTFLPACITLLAYWGIGFGFGWWLGFGRGQGAPGLWAGLIAGLSAAALLLAARFGWLLGRLRTRGFAVLRDAPP